jgi:hypothetical protein
MTPLIGIALALAATYLLFLAWYGGNGKPMTRAEVERFDSEFAALCAAPDRQDELDAIRALVAGDDGKEFVMHNLVRYRARARYPEGYDYGDDPRAADRRYAKAILWPLLRHGNLMLFVARRAGRFMQPAGADDWHYVAMVRYRSRRDFLRFALAIERDDIVVHKWAAIEKTHIFPVKPLVSLFFVRGTVAAALVLAGAAAYWIVRASGLA